MTRQILVLLLLVIGLMFFGPAGLISAQDLHVDGTVMLIDDDQEVDGSIFVENGGVLTIRNATVTLRLDYDEQRSIMITGDSKLVVENGVIRSTGGQYWIELSGEVNQTPTMEVSGNDSWITDHAGIRPSGHARVIVTGGDVEELQVRDEVVVELSNAATYPVLFFDGVRASLHDLRRGDSISTLISIPGGWSYTLTNARVEEYQLDLTGGAEVDLDGGEGIVLSLHTPGNLGDQLRIVDGTTWKTMASGLIDNLGTTFRFTNSEITMLNIYVAGPDRVLLRNMRVNEANAVDRSELVIGQKGFSTALNCNLCQVYDHASFTIVNATIDTRDNAPSATSSYADVAPVGEGTMRFVDTDLRELFMTLLDSGSMILDHCDWDADKIEILDDSATLITRSISAEFTATRRSGPAPLQVELIDLSAGTVNERLWDFGDGSQSVDSAPVHTYTVPGTYTVSYTVRSPDGDSTVTKSDYVRVEAGGHRRRAVRRH